MQIGRFGGKVNGISDGLEEKYPGAGTYAGEYIGE